MSDPKDKQDKEDGRGETSEQDQSATEALRQQYADQGWIPIDPDTGEPFQPEDETDGDEVSDYF